MHVFDPFLGSGTLLLEAGRAGLAASGTEINPAAVVLSRTYHLINIRPERRRSYLVAVRDLLSRNLQSDLPLFRYSGGSTQTTPPAIIETKLRQLVARTHERRTNELLQTLIALLDFQKTDQSVARVYETWKQLGKLVLELPYSEEPINVHHADARLIPLPDSSVDLVITSPPYINVFNYHQQYRGSMESLDWDLLKIAKSEIGSNRKHRANRYLTVIQYCLDLAHILLELNRVCCEDSRLIFVVGRESTVRGTRILNGQIVAELAHRALGFDLTLRQERMFVNRFGQKIFEDILHFSPPASPPTGPLSPVARTIAQQTLQAALPMAPHKARQGLISAIDKVQTVQPSPVFRLSHAVLGTREGYVNQDLPTPHGDKLTALIANDKLPSEDLPRVNEAIKRYHKWKEEILKVEGDYDHIIAQMVSLFNDYKYFIEADLIFGSPEDFLYRQKGQLKLDNTIIEEFLPILITRALAEEFGDYQLSFGPTTCLSEIRFESSITHPHLGGGIKLRQKDHDFAITRRLYLQTSYHPDFKDKIEKETQIAYVAAECKTNLDKTMFQEASATAADLKRAVPGAKYFLLCEWLDMTPISTTTTAIDEVLVLRKAKRISSSIRTHFSTVEGRNKHRHLFTEYLKANPFQANLFDRFVEYIREMVGQTSTDRVLKNGHF